MSKNYNNNNKQRKSGGVWKMVGIIVASVLSTCILLSIGSFVKTAFEKEVNPNNLIKVDENYIKTQNTNRGVEIEVADDGTIELSGKATSDHVVTIATVSLEPGWYTLSGLESPDLNEFYLYGVYGVSGQAIAGMDSAVFEVTAPTDIVIKLSWTEDVSFNWFSDRKIQPVLVEGKVAGDFYK